MSAKTDNVRDIHNIEMLETFNDIRLHHLECQVKSIEKSVKDTNKKITAIRNQLRKEKGRGDLS